MTETSASPDATKNLQPVGEPESLTTEQHGQANRPECPHGRLTLATKVFPA